MALNTAIMICELEDKIFNIKNGEFEAMALEIFRFQHANNALYRSFSNALHIDPAAVNTVASIPFLPVSFFKSHRVVSGSFEPEVIFESSGTTTSVNSRHLVKTVDLYRQSFITCFEKFYGPVSGWCIIGLLPSYLERQHSSLVMMVHELISLSDCPSSGFYLYEHDQLAKVLLANEAVGQKTLLIGVTFALLDFAQQFKQALHYTTVMETGGMKGRRKEITREEVHAILKDAWQLPTIHSEYGMTELLSQAYSDGAGLFECPAWMRVLLREEDDPLSIYTPKKDSVLSGLVNVIDLANIHSCSFLAIDDIGKLHGDGRFEILGRMDSSDVRGCSLMI